jgi:hypothetical protein
MRTSGRIVHSPSARSRLSSWVAVVLLAGSLTLIALLLWVFAVLGERATGASQGLVDVALALATLGAWVSMLLAGATLAILRPRNPIGWLLLVGGTLVVLTDFAPSYAELAVLQAWDLPGYRVLDWLQPVFESVGFFLVVFWVPLLFPTGRLPGPRWRAVAWTAAILMPISSALTFVTDNDDPFGRTLPNPTAIGGTAERVVETVTGVLNAMAVLFILLALVSVVVRFRRSAGVERQQLKWFLGGLAVLVASIVAMSIAYVFAIESLSGVLYFAATLTQSLLPIAIGIAVLRYRLYEIDRLISRTIGWALVTVVLVGAFALLVLGSSAVLEPFTGGDTLAVAVSTLAVAALFAPLRGRVQRAVDRRFDRARYDGERLVGAFGERLRDEVDLDTIRSDILATVDAAVRPASVGLWLRERQGDGR